MSAEQDDLTPAEKRWQRVAAADEIPENGALAVSVEERELAVFRAQGRLYCLADCCPHRGAALSEGHIENGEVVCPWHGWRYALADGECSTLPGSMSAITFPLRQDGDDVLVQL